VLVDRVGVFRSVGCKAHTWVSAASGGQKSIGHVAARVWMHHTHTVSHLARPPPPPATPYHLPTHKEALKRSRRSLQLEQDLLGRCTSRSFCSHDGLCGHTRQTSREAGRQ